MMRLIAIYLLYSAMHPAHRGGGGRRGRRIRMPPSRPLVLPAWLEYTILVVGCLAAVALPFSIAWVWYNSSSNYSPLEDKCLHIWNDVGFGFDMPVREFLPAECELLIEQMAFLGLEPQEVYK